jgi:hypothetical protein
VLTPRATVGGDRGIDHFEFFVGGARAGQCKPGEKFRLNTKVLPDGFQEIRIVAIENSIIQSQGRLILTFKTANHGRTIEVTVPPHAMLHPGDKLKLNVASPGSVGIALLHNSRVVARIAGDSGAIEVPADVLGTGIARLQAVGIGKDGPQSHVLAIPIDEKIESRKLE